MRLFRLVLLINTLLIVLIMTGCNYGKSNGQVIVKDTTINAENAITRLVLDSNSVEKFISANHLKDSSARRLRNFYISRNYQYAWFTEDGLAEQAISFWNLRNHYVQYNRDTTLFDPKLNERIKTLSAGDSSYTLYSEETRLLELKLTQQFFEYAQFAYAGKIDPEELQWHIPRKKIDPVALLDSLVINKGATNEWEPVNRLYTMMRSELEKYAEIKEKGGWPEFEMNKNKKVRKGEKDSVILWIRQRLSFTKDHNGNDTSNLYDADLQTAIKKVQNKFGLAQSGIIDNDLVKTLAVPVEKRIEQILINMERMRWLPQQNSGEFIVANIPEFKLHVYENREEVLSMNIVVGQAANKSVIFTDELKYVVFSPYWNVPSSITVNEILPAIRKNPNYLSAKNMEITGYNNGVPVIRQKPGGSNSLGLVKFIFPNSYNIYFHDTPSKSLFERNRRDFSHGCIRLAKPFELAKHLLRNDTSWTDEKIVAAMHLGEEKWVTLPKSIPVLITYFTSWVDNDGAIHFRPDIYGHDARLAERMFN